MGGSKSKEDRQPEAFRARLERVKTAPELNRLVASVNADDARSLIAPELAALLMCRGVGFGCPAAQSLAIRLGAGILPGTHQSVVSEWLTTYATPEAVAAVAFLVESPAILECALRCPDDDGDVALGELYFGLTGSRMSMPRAVAAVVYGQLIARINAGLSTRDRLLAAAILACWLGVPARADAVPDVQSTALEARLFRAAHGAAVEVRPARLVRQRVSALLGALEGRGFHNVTDFVMTTMHRLLVPFGPEPLGPAPPGPEPSGPAPLGSEPSGPAKAEPAAPVAGPAEPAPAEPIPTEPPRVAECPVCLAALPRVAYGCGHVTCEACDAGLLTRECPGCRAPIVSRQRLFF